MLQDLINQIAAQASVMTARDLILALAVLILATLTKTGMSWSYRRFRGKGPGAEEPLGDLTMGVLGCLADPLAWAIKRFSTTDPLDSILTHNKADITLRLAVGRTHNQRKVLINNIDYTDKISKRDLKIVWEAADALAVDMNNSDERKLANKLLTHMPKEAAKVFGTDVPANDAAKVVPIYAVPAAAGQNPYITYAASEPQVVKEMSPAPAVESPADKARRALDMARRRTSV